jgi:DNA helicase-2/ATP-dependent DNA helicase PcrA
MIDGWKNRGLTPDRVPAGEAQGFANGQGGTLYREYQQRLKVVNAADFGDLLLEVLRIFQEHPDVLKEYQRRFKYMLVDEYQDTNVAQYLWLRLLAQGHRNICCVGDDDQSIYGWRGAEVDNILRFEKDFPGAKVIRLERNYRSTPQILGAASGLIEKNESRLGKTLRTDRDDGETVTVRAHWDGDEEARAIGEEIEQLQRKGERLNDIAILVRASFQMRAFEDRFITLGVPYRVIGGPRFYERAEVRDALAYLKVVAAPDNDLAFERIINVPKRGIGETSVKRMHAIARAQGISLYRAAEAMSLTDELPAKTRTALRKLIEGFGRWRQMMDGLPHVELAEIVLDESGYTEMWQNDKSPEAQGRLDNLKELVRSMGEFENLAGFLEHIALVMDVEQSAEEDKVNIMTMHGAKGLEFGTVFLPGWEEGLFPSQRSLDEKGRAGLEEERRLAYVGITRAKRRAFISFAQNRRVHNLWQNALPSRFIDELPESFVAVAPLSSSYGGYGLGSYGASRLDDRQPFANTYATPGWQRAQERWAKGEALRSTPRLVEG